jgi:exopolyphosphatase / guanosine-5'-triphosphate,3'-diphosphate pyrophosphatase
MKYASIDLGTNTVLLLITEIDRKGGLVEILDTSTITRLGEGLKERGDLSVSAMERTYETLSNYRMLAEEHAVEEIHCVGTSALREARNSSSFLTRVREGLGIDVRIISGREEAWYTYLSVRRDNLVADEELIIADIGGGSTEIIKGTQTEFGDFISLPMGTVKLTEMFVENDPPSTREIESLTRYVRGMLNLPLSARTGRLIGTGGTITNAASLLLGLENYEKRQIHGFRAGLMEISELIKKLQYMTISERSSLKGMEKGREDIILQGIILLKEVMLHFGTGELVVSANGVRYGVICERFCM